MGLAAQPVLADPQSDTTQLLDRLTQAGTWHFDLLTSSGYMEIATHCAREAGNDDAKRDACLAPWIERATHDGTRLERVGDQVFWSSVTRGKDGAEHVNLKCPMRVQLVAPNQLSVSPSGPCTGESVPRELRAKAFSAEAQEPEPWGMVLADANTLVRVDKRFGFETFHLKAPVPAPFKVALLPATGTANLSSLVASLNTALHERLTRALVGRAVWVESANLAAAVAKGGGVTGGCGPTCIAAAAAKAGVDYVFVGSVQGEAATPSLTLSAISSRTGAAIGSNVSTPEPRALSRDVGEAAEYAAGFVHMHTMIGWTRPEYDAAVKATVTTPRAEADTRQTEVSLPPVGKVGAGKTYPLPFKSDTLTVVPASAGGQHWLFAAVKNHLYRADARTPQTWTEVPQTGTVLPYSVQFVQANRLWGRMCGNVDWCWAPLASATGAKVQWQPFSAIADVDLTSDGTTLYARPSTSDADIVSARRSVDGKKWSKVAFPGPRDQEATTELLTGPGYSLYGDISPDDGTALLYSSSDGARWQKEFDTATVGLRSCDYAIGSTTATTVVCDNGVVSRNKAGKWQRLVRAPTSYRRFETSGAGALFVRLGSGKFATFDGGTTWYSYTNEEVQMATFDLWFGVDAQTALQFRVGEVVVYPLTPP